MGPSGGNGGNRKIVYIGTVGQYGCGWADSDTQTKTFSGYDAYIVLYHRASTDAYITADNGTVEKLTGNDFYLLVVNGCKQKTTTINFVRNWSSEDNLWFVYGVVKDK